ncbi:MAG: hypothetical protein NTY96_02690 [Bacteroidetes bacterium]|nr:hypothetical protein [Bacteroidota bacterium]
METITREQAIKAAINSIEESDFPHPCTLQRCLENVDLIHCLFIHRLDDPGASYYILYWLINDKMICIAEVDAFNGNILSFTPFTHPATEHYHDTEKFEEMIRIRYPDEVVADSDLVWKPCNESNSSINPFRRVNTDKRTYFISMFGEIYTELTPVE